MFYNSRPEEVPFKIQVMRRNQLVNTPREVFQAEELEMGMFMVCPKEMIRSSSKR